MMLTNTVKIHVRGCFHTCLHAHTWQLKFSGFCFIFAWTIYERELLNCWNTKQNHKQTWVLICLCSMPSSLQWILITSLISLSGMAFFPPGFSYLYHPLPEAIAISSVCAKLWWNLANTCKHLYIPTIIANVLNLFSCKLQQQTQFDQS